MKVICISERDQAPDVDPVKFGEIYTVVKSVERNDRYTGGIFYQLEEKPEDSRYHSSLFSPLSNIDEKEFVREYNKELV